MPFPSLPLLLIPLLVAGCATNTPNKAAPEGQLTPRQISAQGVPSQPTEARWGGVIVRTSNLRSVTEIEIISYPLSESEKPDTGYSPQGRFIAVHSGYLEPLNYAPGRKLTIVGKVKRTRIGQVGEAEYRFPIVSAQEVKLWPKSSPGWRPNFNFGFGIGSGGHSSGGVGVGIGF